VTRALCLAGGVLVLGLAWGWLSGAGFAVHMLRHMSVVAIAAPLLVLGGPALAGRTVSPLMATLLEFAVVWGWHLPALHEAARLSVVWFVAEQGSFLIAGLLIWSAVLRPGGELAGAGGLLLTSMHMTLLGALLILAGRPLYDAICYGGDPLSDQQLGGMLMLAIGTPVYLVAGLTRMAGVLAQGEPAS
jgi:putative membrane protein